MSSEPQERYCSSYYDKHGLYNDGFPCPPDKYCCQSDEDGHKMCCSSVDESKDSSEDYDNTNSGIITTKKHRQKSSPIGGLLFVDKPSKFNSNSRIDNKSLQTSSSSSWPVFFNNNNSNLVLTACLATAVLVLVVLVVVIVLVCLKRRRGHDRATTKRLRGRPEFAISSPAPMGYRMSSSGSSCVTSSTTPSPKTDEQLTIICPSSGDMDHVAEEQKKMLKSLSNHHNHHYSQSRHHQLNLTQSSFVTSSTKSNHNMLDLMLNEIDVDDDDEDDEEAILEPPPPMPPTNDFISTTSTNLEFLKTHSLFDSTPLNYYPQPIKDNSLQPPPPPYSVDSGRFSTFMGPPSLTSIYNNHNPNKINNNDFV